MRVLRACALVAAAALIGGCGGGGGVTAPSVLTPSSPQPQPTQQQQAQHVSVAFNIVVGAASTASALRAPKYVSASTQSAAVTVTPSGGNAGTPVVVNCTTVCSGSVSAPVGSDTFTINLYDTQNAGGHLLSTGTLTQTVVANVANSVNATFNGVVTSLSVMLNPSSIIPGNAGAATVTVNALDADNNVIVGPGVYVNASGTPVTVTLSNSDITGNSSLSATTLMQSTSGITLNYTAALAAAPTITAAATGLTSAHAQLLLLAPTLTALSAASGLQGAGITQTLTGTNFAGNTTVNVSGGGVTVGSVSVTSSTSLTANFFVSPTASTGPVSVTATTNVGTTTAQSFTINTTPARDVVTLPTDASPGAPPGTGTGLNGDLRHAILNAQAGDTIVFNCGNPCTITLGGPLPPITQNLTVDGGMFGQVVIDGNALYRAFFVDTGTVALRNLRIQHAQAHGGNGVDDGGGGAGLGAGLFVNQAGAAVSVANVYFLNCAASGGAGSSGGATSWGGGGGLGGDGGTGNPGGLDQNGGGGGGVLAVGASSVATNVGGQMSGGGGGAALGGGAGNASVAGLGATAYAGNAAGANGSSGVGGAGGFGGGGGGAFPSGGAGGFGGGGGGSSVNGGAGNGGAGGGGAGGNIGGAGGTLATVAGGNGATGNGFGGGGAAAGPAIFVRLGSLTTTNSGATGSAATGGAAGAGNATPGTADATPVFNFGGTINGLATTGPVSGALTGSMPMSIRRRSP